MSITDARCFGSAVGISKKQLWSLFSLDRLVIIYLIDYCITDNIYIYILLTGNIFGADCLSLSIEVLHNNCLKISLIDLIKYAKTYVKIEFNCIKIIMFPLRGVEGM